MYINTITNKVTNHPYRFKTEEEFIEEFGEGWRNKISWYDEPSDSRTPSEYYMDYLLGIDLEFGNTPEEVDDSFGDRSLIRNNGWGKFNDVPDEYGWSYTVSMIIRNKKRFNYFTNPKDRLVYESIDDNEYKNIICKFIEEEDIINLQKLAFKNEFFWYISGNQSYEKDEIRKFDLSEPQYIAFDTEEHDIINNNSNIKRHIITYGNEEVAIKKIYGESTLIITDFNDLLVFFNETLTFKQIYNRNKKLVYENNVNKKMDYKNSITGKYTKYKYRFKTREEFVEQFGNFWKDVLGGCWSYDMDRFFGMNFVQQYNTIIDKSNYMFYKHCLIRPIMLKPNDTNTFKIIYSEKKLCYD